MTDEKALTLRTGNSFDLVRRISDDSVQLVVTSPPYNIGKSYEQKTSLDEYLEPYVPFAKELYRAVATGGSVCWQVGNFVSKGEVVPLDVVFYPLFREAGFVLRNRVIWHFRHGLHAQRRFSGRYETVLWFSKGDPKFNLDPVRVPSLYPGKRRFKGPRKGELSGNPLGKNPSDFWPDLMLEEWERGIWDFPNVKANHPEKSTHPCQFPVELVERCVLAFSDHGDLVLDPFLGVGSAAVGAMRHGRRFIGFDVDKEYVREARQRVKLDEQGLLKTRSIGTPVASPKGKVAELPEEWA
jgi:adenine-specific DNA-methyltransferase